ncbi:response regulator transcription factor [Chromohalobacter israelensis]|uniref:response regulator transcription factor n=1 Tax=Chromohalobacter israelensis TaxID=141390 RepID=UPI0015C43BF2|nr:response regulator [Chromohalobacter salexigens]NWO56035.1 hypothetical protein [Chromohalobacter salexigens]
MNEKKFLRVLIVEDDENKKDRIQKYYQDTFEFDEVLWSSSLVSGLRVAKNTNPDFIILDMTLPNYEADAQTGFNPMRPFGGREFLRQAVRLRLKSKIVVVTQFETFGAAPNLVDLSSLDFDLRKEFPDQYLGAIYYHASMSAWQKKLSEAREICKESIE